VKAEILCIQPPVYDFALYDLFFKPYGLLSIAGWLQEGGYRVPFLNALDYEDARTVRALGRVRRKSDGTGKFHRMRAELPEGIRPIRRRFGRYGVLPEVLEEKIRRAHPDVVLVTSQMTYWYPGVVEAVEMVKRHHPGVPVIVGGVYATLMPEHCRRVTGADEVVAGDGFSRLPEILARYGLESPAKLPPPSAAVPVMDPGVWKQAGILRLNRGCPFHCTYCASRILEPDFQAGDFRMVFEWMRELHTRYRIRNFAFYDDALLFDRERVLLPLLEEVIRRELDLRFFTPNAVHMRYIDAETASLMKRAGFREVRLGYESADEEFHRQLDRKYSPEEVPQAIKVLRRAGFTGRQLLLYVLAGLPGQRVSEVERTLHIVSRYKVKVSIAEYSPVPRTGLWPEAVRDSSYPVESEPLYHNNTFFPMEWEGFTRDDMQRVKALSHELEVR